MATETDPKTKETHYILLRDGKFDAHVRKFEDKEEVDGYVIEDGMCSCAGSHYRGDCRHISMLKGLPPTKPMPSREAYNLAVLWMKKLRSEGTEIKIVGDIAERRDPVHVVHYVIMDETGYQKPFRMVWWDKGLAFMFDKVTPEFLKEQSTELVKLRLFE